MRELIHTSTSDHPLSANDYSLRMAYDSAPVIDKINREISRQIACLPEDKPLVILASEAHIMPMHKMMQIGILNYLAARQNIDPEDKDSRFIFSYEQPANVLADIARRVYRIKFPAGIDYTLNSFDRDGQTTLKALMAYNPYKLAPISLSRVFQCAVQNNIPTIFSDAGRDGKYLCRSDPLYAQSRKLTVGNYKDFLSRKINPDEDHGVALRNIMMVSRALAKARESKARVIVQQCGRDHVFGNDMRGRMYDFSLARLFAKEGANVIPIFNFNEIDNADIEYWQSHPGFQDFPESFVIRGQHEGHHIRAYPFRENNYLKLLRMGYSAKPCPFPEKSHMPDSKSLRGEIHEIVQRAMDEGPC